MRTAVVALALGLWATTGWAGDNQGKWGLGVDSGLFRSGGVHGALIHRRSTRTAWLLDVRAEEHVLDTDGSGSGLIFSPFSPPVASGEFSQTVQVEIGPRFRRFTRPDANWSPYWDLFAAATHSNSRYSSGSTTADYFSTGGAAGAGIGVEYFTPWHFSVAAHSDLLEARYARVRSRGNDSFLGPRSASGHEQSVNTVLNPAVELRAYF